MNVYQEWVERLFLNASYFASLALGALDIHRRYFIFLIISYLHFSLVHLFVKLTNVADCVKRGFVPEGGTPLEVASQTLLKDEINVIHTIGGDDTNTQAAELSKYLLEKHNGKVIVVGMPKTVDNDVYPIRQTFGADTAAEQGAIFFENVVSESTANPRMLIVHECMGRDSGFLTAATAKKYRERLATTEFVEGLATSKASRDIHAVWIPELDIDIEQQVGE